MSITPEETIKILTAKAECMRRETSGIDIDCNYRNCDECDLCYKQGTTGDQMEALRVAISALQEQDLQPTCNNLATNTISRKAAIDAVDSETVSTNPEHFKSSEKFIKFMDDADIASFGKWQWANGFNTAVVAARR